MRRLGPTAESWSHAVENFEGDNKTKELVAKIIAAVLAGFEEISPSLMESDDEVWKILQTFHPHEDLRHWNQAATSLVDSRSIDFLRTCLALIIYVFSVFQALFPKIGGGSTTPPGGRIACSVFLSWLIPMVLLSNTFGTFPSRRTCADAMLNFMDKMIGDQARTEGPKNQDCISRWATKCYKFEWLESIYSYRRSDHNLRSGEILAKHKSWISVAAFVPTTISMVGSFIILWWAVPIGLGCRHFWVIAVYSSWILTTYHIFGRSVRLLCWVVNKLFCIDFGRIRSKFWIPALAKDVFIGLCTIAFPTASNLGAWNNCECWSTKWNIWSREEPYMGIGETYMYEKYGQTVYFWAVGLSFLAQAFFYVGIILTFRKGLKAVRWWESDLQKRWAAADGERRMRLLRSELSSPKPAIGSEC
jgi:hypothetical protein